MDKSFTFAISSTISNNIPIEFVNISFPFKKDKLTFSEYNQFRSTIKDSIIESFKRIYKEFPKFKCFFLNLTFIYDEKYINYVNNYNDCDLDCTIEKLITKFFIDIETTNKDLKYILFYQLEEKEDIQNSYLLNYANTEQLTQYDTEEGITFIRNFFYNSLQNVTSDVTKLLITFRINMLNKTIVINDYNPFYCNSKELYTNTINIVNAIMDKFDFLINDPSNFTEISLKEIFKNINN